MGNFIFETTMEDNIQEVSSSVGKMSKKTKMIIGGVIALVVVAAVANKLFSKSAAERVIESATGGNAKVDPKTGEVTVKTDQGTWSSSGELPKDFPSDVPVYHGAKVQGSVAAAQQQGGGQYVGLESTDSTDDVVNWYKAAVVTEGWKVTSNIMANGNLLLGATKDTRELAVTVSSQDGKVAIGLVVTQKQ